MRTSHLIVLALLVGCGHASSFDGGVLSKGDARLRVGPVPSTWLRIQVDGADLAFRDDAREGSMLLDVRCDRRDDDAPLSALTAHLIMGTTERDIESQDVEPFDGREAMRTVLGAKLDGVPMKYDIYVTKKNGCVYDLVYVAPPDRFVAGERDFERFVAGVETLPSRSAAELRPAAASRDP